MKKTYLLAGETLETGSVNAKKLYSLLVKAAVSGSRPTYRDLMNAMEFSSPAPILCILRKFESRGYIKTIEASPV